VLAVEVDEGALVEALLAAGRLDERQALDRKAVQSAVASVLAQWTERWASG
jgi:hypothetical protein